MSSAAVRSVIRTELQNYLAGLIPPIAFYETINEQATPMQDIWVTVDFQALSTEHRCYEGVKRIEQGNAVVSIFVKPGTGDNDAVLAAEAMQMFFDGFESNGVVIVSVLPPNETTGGTAQNYYGVEIIFEYDYFN